ncbi:Neuronal acetylcholine receptor subunit alpha-4 [Fasciola hepatica]|uniref:Neuronal acetylcholine receptor subunit alpha-4 n=1 Tax=Fasciola hepatica TaxID=6192 RepID=A0A4E0QYZ3_FASHE|nr:Neuronal acetylcholine receptor subunit alpha-4 [Fasciola hepatica]
MKTCLYTLIMGTVLICLGKICTTSAEIPGEISTEKSLIHLLLNRYKEFGVIGRPVRDSRIKMVIQYGLQLIQILHLDENKQVLRTNCWTIYRWVDPLLTWNASQFEDLKVVRMLPGQIWTPDIKLYNFADERLQEYREGGLLVHNDGTILWLQQALFKSTCQVETTYFPFDSQASFCCMRESGGLCLKGNSEIQHSYFF